jgi:hypothetical protein
VGDVVELFGGPVARLYRRSLTDQGFEVLMMTVFDIAARLGYAVARSIVKGTRSLLPSYRLLPTRGRKILLSNSTSEG